MKKLIKRPDGTYALAEASFADLVNPSIPLEGSANYGRIAIAVLLTYLVVKP